MQFIVFDFEVLTHDWLVVFKKGEEITVIKNDKSLLFDYYNQNKHNVFVGFNNKNYDDFIFKGILSGLDPKRVSDYIITRDKNGWDYPGLENIRINTLDVKQDLSANLHLSLKEAEGNMGISIEESSIDFNIDRKLSEEELNELIAYCKHDVTSTEKILLNRKNDITTRLELITMFNLPITDIGKTNAKITATILEARKRKRYDEHDYDFPKNLLLANNKIRAHFSQKINYDNTLKETICGIEHVIAYGGLHGAKKGVFEGNIWYVDVKSYYPSLMLEYDYISRNLKTSKQYKDIYDLRMKYKAEKDPKEKGLKLLLNTCYGAMKNQYNDLYDPKQANQVCITGQLFLIDLLEKLEPHINLLQTNTDGIIFQSYNDEKVKMILDEWQQRTRMVLDIDKVDKIWQKDVNNYIILKNGKIKVKGAYVKDYFGGTFAQNTTTIIDEAVVNYFVYRTPVSKTILDCNDLIRFQYISKKGPTYLRVEHDGQVVNNCNRVFASKNKSLGKLYKVKENGRKDSIANLPDNCIIVNEDLSLTNFTIKDVDKHWYIKQAFNRIRDFEEGIS